MSDRGTDSEGNETMLLTIMALLAADAEQTKPAAAEKPVCRSVGRTGTLFARRVCHTPAEWAAIDAADRAETEKVRDGMRRGDNRPS